VCVCASWMVTELEGDSVINLVYYTGLVTVCLDVSFSRE